jgi:hypothetical protein
MMSAYTLFLNLSRKEIFDDSMGWEKRGEEVVEFVMSFGLGIGVTLYVLGSFVTAMGASAGGNAVNAIIAAVESAVTTVAGPLITISLILLIYILAKNSGAMGGKKKKGD